MTAKDELQYWIDHGEPDEILRDLVESPHRHPSASRALLAARQALSAAADEGTSNVVDLAFHAMLKFNTGLMLRLQLMCDRKLVAFDSEFETRKLRMDPALADELLPALTQVQLHVAAIAKSYATTRHLLKIATPARNKRSGPPPLRIAGFQTQKAATAAADTTTKPQPEIKSA